MPGVLAALSSGRTGQHPRILLTIVIMKTQVTNRRCLFGPESVDGTIETILEGLVPEN